MCLRVSVKGVQAAANKGLMKCHGETWGKLSTLTDVKLNEGA